MATDIKPFFIKASDEQLEDLKRRLRHTRWPDAEVVDDWSQGMPLAYTREVCRYWAEEYDWRARESRLNSFPQFKTEIDGLGIHFIHVRSPEKNALPLVMTHGWPGSVVEFLKVIGPLSDPASHGGDRADAFHVVCPSLPGYGYSDTPRQAGFGVLQVATAWTKLMLRLGYQRYVAQGGDWGSMVTTEIGIQDLAHCAGIQTNMPITLPDPATMNDLTPREQAMLAVLAQYEQWDSGYWKQQSTRPQTLGYSLADSPAGQAAWIIEKFWSWMDCDGHPENVLSRDELLDNVMLYWLPGAATSSARLYWESYGQIGRAGAAFAEVTVKTGCSIYPKEIFRSSRRWAAKRYTNIVHWNEPAKGGHFAAFEQPEIFVNELRTCFRHMRGGDRLEKGKGAGPGAPRAPPGGGLFAATTLSEYNIIELLDRKETGVMAISEDVAKNVRAYHAALAEGRFKDAVALMAPGMTVYGPYGVIQTVIDDQKATAASLDDKSAEGFRLQETTQYIQIQVLPGRAAVATYLTQGSVVAPKSEKVQQTLRRTTQVWELTETGWMIVHMHVSNLEHSADPVVLL